MCEFFPLKAITESVCISGIYFISPSISCYCSSVVAAEKVMIRKSIRRLEVLPAPGTKIATPLISLRPASMWRFSSLHCLLRGEGDGLGSILKNYTEKLILFFTFQLYHFIVVTEWKEKNRHIRVNLQCRTFLFCIRDFFFFTCVFKLFSSFLDVREEKLREGTWCRTVGIWLIYLETTLIGGSDTVNNAEPSILTIFPILFLLIFPALSLVSLAFILLFPGSFWFSNVSFIFLICISFMNFTVALSGERVQSFGFLLREWAI